MSSSWHSLFQKHRGQFPVCDTVRPTKRLPQQPIQRAQVGHPLKSRTRRQAEPRVHRSGFLGIKQGRMKTWKSFAFLLSSKTFPPSNIPELPSRPHQNRKGATRPPPLVTTVSTAVAVVDGPPDPLVPVGAGVVSTPSVVRLPGLVRVPFPVPSRPENNNTSASTPPLQGQQTTYTPPSPPW